MPPKLEFEYDKPLVVHLRYPQGKEVVSRYYQRFHGDTVQYIFSAEEGVFYVPEDAGGLLNARLRSRGVIAGQAVAITKRRVSNPNSLRPHTEYFCAVNDLTRPYLTQHDLTPQDGTRPRAS